MYVVEGLGGGELHHYLLHKPISQLIPIVIQQRRLCIGLLVTQGLSKKTYNVCKKLLFKKYK
jgi:hypothetical protein